MKDCKTCKHYSKINVPGMVSQDKRTVIPPETRNRCELMNNHFKAVYMDDIVACELHEEERGEAWDVESTINRLTPGSWWGITKKPEEKS